MRHAVFAHLHTSAAVKRALDPGLNWWHWPVPIALQLAIVAIIGATALGLAVLEFRVTE